MPIVKDARQLPPGDSDEPGQPREDPRLNWSIILDAPEIGAFLKREETARAKEYRGKVNSLLNAALQLRLADPNGLPDVSAILQRGPATALRAGALADDNDGFRKALDIITAPDNPAVMFAFAVIPLVTQLLRNHEDGVKDLREKRATRRNMTGAERKAARETAKANRPRVEFKLFGRTWRLPLRKFRLNLGGMLHVNTVAPEYLVSEVIGDPKVRAELSKRFGVKWGNNGQTPSGD